MKIEKQHYEYLKNVIRSTISNEEFSALVKEIKDTKKYKDLGTYLRWFILKIAKLTSYVCDTLYTYLNDDHIDSALKKICKELNFVEAA